jgi:hypothetical protein
MDDFTAILTWKSEEEKPMALTDFSWTPGMGLMGAVIDYQA